MRIKPNSSGTSQSRQVTVLQSLNVRARNKPLQQGFTLLEIMVVMIIMAIVAAIGIPAFSSWREKQAVHNAAQSLMAQLKQARALAVSENRSVKFTFPLLTSTTNSPTNHYIFDSDTTMSPSPPCTQCKNETVTLTQYSRNLSLSANVNPITFKSRGTSSSATVTLRSGSFSKAVSINMIGRAYLQ